MKRNEIDRLIEDSIAVKQNSFEPGDEVLIKIKDNIKSRGKRSNYNIIKIHYRCANSLKAAAGFMCILVIFCSISLLVSPDARAFASNVIKTIFTIDENGRVIERGQDEPILNDGFGMETNLSDIDIQKKVGFKVVIPDSLSDGFKLSSKMIALFLGEDISYETSGIIRSTCMKAIFDDTAFESLLQYKPSRSAGGHYKNAEGEITLLASKEVDRYYKAIEVLKKSKANYKEIKVSNVKGIWVEEKRAVYPADSKGSADYTQKPIRLVNTYDVIWAANALIYFMSTSDNIEVNGGYKLSPESAARIAESFMVNQK